MSSSVVGSSLSFFFFCTSGQNEWENVTWVPVSLPKEWRYVQNDVVFRDMKGSLSRTSGMNISSSSMKMYSLWTIEKIINLQTIRIVSFVHVETETEEGSKKEKRVEWGLWSQQNEQGVYIL